MTVLKCVILLIAYFVSFSMMLGIVALVAVLSLQAKPATPLPIKRRAQCTRHWLYCSR